MRAGGHREGVAGDHARFLTVPGHLDGLRSGEAGGALHGGDVVALEVLLDVLP